MSAREIFYEVFGNRKNMLTPTVASRRKKGRRLAYELSTGTSIRDTIIYGVTVVRFVDGEWRFILDDSKVFYSYDDAMNYVKSLR